MQSLKPTAAVVRRWTKLQVTLVFEDVPRLHLGRDVSAGVVAVEEVGRPHDDVVTAGTKDRVDRDHFDVVRGGILEAGAHGGGVLRVQDDGLGTLVDEVLDLLVLQGSVGAVSIAANQWADELRRPFAWRTAARSLYKQTRRGCCYR